MRKLIIFLIRKKLGVKKFEYFKFDNQKSADIYYIDNYNIMKIVSDDKGYLDHPVYIGKSASYRRSTVSLNWVMSINKRRITKV